MLTGTKNLICHASRLDYPGTETGAREAADGRLTRHLVLAEGGEVIGAKGREDGRHEVGGGGGWRRDIKRGQRPSSLFLWFWPWSPPSTSSQ